jgi:hypothetical protein
VVFEADDIRDWRGKEVVDADGSKIGTLEAVYFDTAMQLPTFASVKVGMIGRHRLVFVPLAGARVAPRHVRVMADKKLVKNGPSIDLDGELTAEAANRACLSIMDCTTKRGLPANAGSVAADAAGG